MNKNIFVFVYIVFFVTSINSQWINQFSSSNCSGINDLSFSDSLNGIAVGFYSNDESKGRIMYTTNSGINWNFSTLPDSTQTIISSRIISSNLYYSGGCLTTNVPKNTLQYIPEVKPNDFESRDRKSKYQQGIFLKSTDKGSSWIEQGQTPDEIEYYTSIYFLNASYGFANCSIGQGFQVGALVKTTNGGLSWTFLSMPTNFLIMNSIVMIDSLNIISVGTKQNGPQYNGMILKSTDSGNSWTFQLYANVSTFKSVTFINALTGIAVGNANPAGSGSIYKTTNKGISWFSITSNLSDSTYLNEVKFLSNGVGMIAGNKLNFATGQPGKISILKSTDYGATWKRNIINSVNLVSNGLEMVSLLNCYVGGGNLFNTSSIYNTTDGGETFIHNISNEVPEKYTLMQNYPNPFNPITTFKYHIHDRGFVSISVFDVTGKEVSKLVNEEQIPGSYIIQFDAGSLSSGTYFYRLQVNNFNETKKMLILK